MVGGVSLLMVMVVVTVVMIMVAMLMLMAVMTYGDKIRHLVMLMTVVMMKIAASVVAVNPMWTSHN